MKQRSFVLFRLAVVVTGLAVFGSMAFADDRFHGAQSTDQSREAPDPSTSLRMRGTIERFEASNRVLSLSTGGGTVRFPVAPGARVRQGRRKIDTQALEGLTGYRAAVRYSESAGTKTAESIHVFNK
jgi:hypothetical protein